MNTLKGVSAIVYDNNGSPFFLIFRRIKNWRGWEFPKGRIAEGEDSMAALEREMMEETGIDTFTVKKQFDKKREWVQGEDLHSFDVFLIEASMNIPVLIDTEEHDTYLWATAERAEELLTWPDERSLFKEAMEFIRNDTNKR